MLAIENVALGIENVPFSACTVVVKVYAPVPDVNVPPLLVTPPRKLIGELIALFHVAPELSVTRPENSLVPVAELNVIPPFIPPPIVVVPVTVRLKAPTANVVPSLIIRSPVTAVMPVVVFVPLPERVTMPGCVATKMFCAAPIYSTLPEVNVLVVETVGVIVKCSVVADFTIVNTRHESAPEIV